MDTTEIRAAQEALDNLFLAMGIAQVVCVDDQYATGPPVEDVIGFCGSLRKDMVVLRQAAPELGDVRFEGDDEVWRGDLRRCWPDLEMPVRLRIYHVLHGKVSADRLDDAAAVSVLDEIMRGVKPKFVRLSLAGWKTAQRSILTTALGTRTLFLCDQNLSGEGGSDTEGVAIIGDVARQPEAENIVCGLLSHMFEPEEEQAVREELAQGTNLDPTGFVLVAKRRLQDDAMEFVGGIRRVVLNRLCTELKDHAAKVLSDANEKARASLQELDTYDFEDMVFGSSQREGVSEADTLFRVFGIYHRFHAREMARQDLRMGSLLSRMRLAATPVPSRRGVPQKRGWHIQRLELYEDGRHINGCYMPIEQGDIFATKDGSRQFVLLGQPCDLAVRADGSRHNTVTESIIVEIESKKPNTGADAIYDLPCFDAKTGAKSYVNLRKRHFVQLFVLDLCVYNTEGVSDLRLNEPCPDMVTLSWREHYSRIVEKAQVALDGHRQGGQEVQRPGTSTMEMGTAECYMDRVFRLKIDPANRRLTYDCKRVGRLCRAHATALLLKFANHLTRAAMDHPLVMGND